MSYQSIRLVDENRLEEALSECGGGSMITITDITSEGDYEGETVTVSVGTYSKTAVIEDGTATIKGFTETGIVTVSVSDFTKTFNIDKYSKYEVSVGSVVGFYEQWLDSIDESSASYLSLADVLADEKMVRELFTRHASVDFLVDSVGNYPEELETIINNDYCAKWINLRDYALDTLYANQLIASLMDQADKYFYGEWVITDNTTTPPTWAPKGNVPVMTSNTAPYGEVIGSTAQSGYSLYQAFDDNISTCWASYDTSPTYSSCGYKFTNPICVKRVAIVFREDMSTKYKVQASNDGTTWTDLTQEKTYTPSGTREPFEEDIDNNSFYLYYRLYGVVPTSGARMNVFTLQFYGRELKVSVPKMTSSTAPYGEVSASENYDSSNYYKIFDGFKTGDNDRWMFDYSTAFPGWITYKFPTKIKLKKVLAWLVEATPPRSLKPEFKMQGSNDGVNYFDLSSSLSIDTLNAMNYFDIDDVYSDGFSYIRFYIMSNNGYNLNNGYGYELQFYGLDYSEYDWDADNPRHYIYDHGVELEDLTLVGSVYKDSDCLKLIAANAQAYKSIDTTNYTLLRGIVGANASGTNVLLCGSGSATFTADYMPYNQSLDVSSINSTNSTGVKKTSSGTFDAAEIWLE